MTAPAPVGDPAFEDLTARARIRDAALHLFAERGIDRATIRDIARSAGVSAGLVRHHFGSKEALRDACDAHALNQLLRFKEQAAVEGELANPAFLPTAHPTLLLLMRYFARSMVDGSPAAAVLFDRLVEFTERWLIEHSPERPDDLRAYAASLVAMQTGLLAMHDHLSRALNADIFAVDGHLRMTRAVLDIHSHTLLDPERAAQAYAAFDRLQPRRPPTQAEPASAAEGAP